MANEQTTATDNLQVKALELAYILTKENVYNGKTHREDAEARALDMYRLYNILLRGEPGEQQQQHGSTFAEAQAEMFRERGFGGDEPEGGSFR